MLRFIPGTLALLVGLMLSSVSAFSQETAADSLPLSLREALNLGLQRNPEVLTAGYNRSAAGAGLWDAYGNFLPRVNLSGQLQRVDQGTFVLFGREFESPQSYNTGYSWDLTHSLLDSGRDLFRLRNARANVDQAIAGYDLQTLSTATQIETQYLEARRRQALLERARAEIQSRTRQLQLAQGRYDVGSVTKSDVLLAEVELNRAEVAVLQATQQMEEARLGLRRLLGGALPERPLALTTTFHVFEPAYVAEDLVARALRDHPSLQESRARQEADAAQLWIARTAYLPSLSLQYSLQRTAADTIDFAWSDFAEQSFVGLALNWQVFSGFERHNQTSQANAALQSARAEEVRRSLQLEQDVRTAFSRLETAYASHQVARQSVDLAAEDLRLGEARYQTGTGSFVDLVDARTRSAQADIDLITATYDFYLALVQLELATGLNLLPTEVDRP
ncbi:MAG TPA: TolC family protein [Gemmatimonadota bacterium]|nr:TolC family protein [Gemmatimonadota bacterium]